ncbi:MAG: ABC transporter permease [Bacteroidota bacterium]
MLKNYLKVAIRNLIKNKAYSAINILGLALGLMVSIIVFLYVKDETSYEKHVKDYDQIYRIGIKASLMGLDMDAPVSCNPMANSLRTEFPEVITATRIRSMRQEIMLAHEEKKIYIQDGTRADSFFFQVFNYTFVHGDPHEALKDDNSMVLTEETARKFFGEENPMGKIIRYDDRQDYIVQGVVAEPNGKSHFHFDFFIPQNDLQPVWISNNFYTYVKLRPETDPIAFRDKMSEKFTGYIKPNVEQFLQITMEEFMEAGNSFEYDMHSIASIHLYSHRDWELKQNSDIMYIYIFIAVAILVLLIAGINFMNLSTARSSKRAKEVGIRKVSGASRAMLISQFLIESILQSVIALFIAFIMVEFFLPGFNQVMKTDLVLLNESFATTLGFALIVTMIYGLFSGSYPALFLSGFQPIKILKGDMTKTKEGAFFRKALVVVQFAASIILIIGMSVIFLQISFMHNKNLGFKGDQVMVVPIQTDKMANNFDDYKGQFEKIPGVLGVGRSSYLPGDTPNQNMFELEGRKEQLPLWNMEVDFDFFKTLGLEMAEGEPFRKELEDDSTTTYIINEAAVKSFNLENPIGKRIVDHFDNSRKKYGKVIGIVKDFHIEGFTSDIKPMILSTRSNLWWTSFKLESENMSETIASVEKAWNRVEPSHPFRYTFLDASFGSLFEQQENFGTMFLYLTILAIIISCMGLYGLAAFTAEQKTKEIGIRKVLGASIPQLMQMLSSDFLKLVLLANIIAWPASLILARNWLSGFSYQIDMPWLPFILAALAALLIAMVTVSHQAYLAAVSDPVKALKYE